MHKNKGVDQLCGYDTADHGLCFRYIKSTIPLLPKSGISSLKPSVAVKPGLYRNGQKPRSQVFSLICVHFQLHFPKYLTSDVYYKYLSELVSTVQTGQDFPLGPRKRRGNSFN